MGKNVAGMIDMCNLFASNSEKCGRVGPLVHLAQYYLTVMGELMHVCLEFHPPALSELNTHTHTNKNQEARAAKALLTRSGQSRPHHHPASSRGDQLSRSSGGSHGRGKDGLMS